LTGNSDFQTALTHLFLFRYQPRFSGKNFDSPYVFKGGSSEIGGGQTLEGNTTPETASRERRVNTAPSQEATLSRGRGAFYALGRKGSMSENILKFTGKNSVLDAQTRNAPNDRIGH
jgi:hypothetical protein